MIATFRRRLLRIHGSILTLVALVSAVGTTIGWRTGSGPFGFMQQNPMVWVGLIQAYLLMTIIAVLLVIGSGQANPRKWNVVGALAHCPPLIAALSSLDVFESMGALSLVRVAITFHFRYHVPLSLVHSGSVCGGLSRLAQMSASALSGNWRPR
jgi:hypothetical protein